MNTEIKEYSPTAAALAELRQKYEQAVFDTTTPIGMAKAIAARRELREVRVNLEKLRKELKAPALERSRLIDAEAKALTAQIEAMEEPIDSQIKAEEQRKAAEKAEKERIERERIEALHRRVGFIREQPTRYVGKTAAEIEAKIGALSGMEIGTDFAELQGDAHTAKAEAIATLTEMHAKAQEQEREADRLRVEREALEAERKAQAEQAERDRAELAKLRAEQQAREKAAQAEIEKQMEAERARVAAERAEQARLQAIEDAKRREEEAKAAAIRAAEQEDLDRQRAEMEHQQRMLAAENAKIEAEKQKLQTGYALLESFVSRFGGEKEFAPVAKQIQKWLDSKREVAA